MRAGALILGTLSILAAQPGGRIARASPTCDLGYGAYERTLFPLQRQRCASCHGESGPASGHSVENSRIAYQRTLELVDFGNLAGSSFVRKIRQKHWLSYDPGVPGATEDEAKKSIQAWFHEGQGFCPPAYAWMGAATRIPGEIPKREDGSFLDLSLGTGPSGGPLERCEFRVEIQEFTPGKPTEGIPKSYRIRRLRISCDSVSGAVTIRGVVFALNGKIDSYSNEYQSVIEALPPSAVPFERMLAFKEMILISSLEPVPEGDRLSITLNQID